ncbi:SAM-dependent methyltransferase [Extibacter muris]|uniref:SAM-dependent methyltransferase n=1 Tax=Extibacter muris TaxID=1796622 RepID=UPI001D07C215|nr:SAM-dependent methyltransferase [Extibacter muris]MCB6203506.1 SAM-dependent methyltransferase [Extibacter muris]MCQ4665394.1 SAM-dependent methyltransferase [Extibacter muris]MCQ4695258.1 SAM-dependent methyltransferase [Extibacter muris]
MAVFEVHPVGKIRSNGEGAFIELQKEYVQALTALEGFSHVNVIWWFSDFDNDKARAIITAEQPYKQAPDEMGVFATRSPIRPNPIALTTSEVIGIDYENGIVQIAYTDANDASPVLDIKPYTPSLDRVEEPGVPGWCGHWPKSIEASADFAWEEEFNF